MTIKDLAKLAGVSSAAVSRYLNGGSLSEKKREIIRSAIEQTGYQPDAAAQALRTKTTDFVGIIVPKLDSESVSRLTAGVSEVLLSEGFLNIIAISQNNPERELGLLNLMQKRSAAGVILMATAVTPRHEALIRQLSIPVVVTGQRFPHACCVYHDDFGATLELTRLVLQRGRTKPVWLGVTEQDIAVGVARKQGVLAALEEAGLPAQLPWEQCSFTVESGKAGMEKLLVSHPDLDAVLCATDRIAFGAMEALRQAGRTVGTDVSVTGVGDSWACRHIAPNLTTAHFHYKTCGRTAARQLIELMRSKEANLPVRQTMLSYEICQRDSI